MRQTKRRIEPLTFFNRDGICTHLEKQAARGWMIEKLTNLGWVYRRVEPKQVKFAVSYYPKASEFDPEPTEGQKTFHEFCAHTGWQLACASGQLQIFYNEREHPTPIETEPELELEAIHASAKKSFIPAYLLLLVVSVLQGAMFVQNLMWDPLDLLSSPSQLFTGFCFVLLFLLCAVELVCYFRWRAKAKKAADHGEFLSPPDTAIFQKVILVVILLSALYYAVSLLFSGDPMRRWLLLLMCVYLFLLFWLVNKIKEFLKRKKAPRGVNRTVTFTASFVLSFVMVGVITLGTLKLSQSGFFAASGEETYDYGGMTWVIHRDELPLTVEDLVEVDYDGYIRERSGDESLLLGQFELDQRPRFDAPAFPELPELRYNMTVVKAPFLYDFCKSWLLAEPEKEDIPEFARYYEEEDPAPWGADEVYRLHDPEYGPRNTFLLCYGRTLVEIRFYWELTPEQMATVGEKLGG